MRCFLLLERVVAVVTVLAGALVTAGLARAAHDLYRALRFLEVRERNFDARYFDGRRRRRRLGLGRVRSEVLSVE
jgi:hypothetical protein